MQQGISRDEWLKALGESVAPPDPDALTVRELAAMFELGLSAMKDRVRGLLLDKKITRSTRIIVDAQGRKIRVPAYKLVKGKR